MPRRPDLPCAGCGKLMWRGSTSLPAGRAVCRACRRIEPRPYGGNGRASTACPVCCREFMRRLNSRGQPVRTCSRYCGQQLRKRTEVAAPCDDCGGLTVRGRNQFGRLCEGCAKGRRLLKYMKRRAAMRQTDITASHLGDLLAEANRCPLCQVSLTAAPGLPASKHVDHIVPLNIGGTHTVGNVRVVCRTCNLRRPKDGSDLNGFQPTPWAEDLKFSATLTARPRGMCLCGERRRAGRCWSCQPPRHRRRPEDGRRAAEMRAAGDRWQDIADALRFSGPGAAYTSARTFGAPDVVAR